MSTITNTLIKSEINTIDGDGNVLSEVVDISVDDFKAFSMQESVTLEETLDPDTFARFIGGDLTVEDFAKSPKMARAVLFAKVKAAIKDPRIRANVTIEDFDLDLSLLGSALSQTG